MDEDVSLGASLFYPGTSSTPSLFLLSSPPHSIPSSFLSAVRFSGFNLFHHPLYAFRDQCRIVFSRVRFSQSHDFILQRENIARFHDILVSQHLIGLTAVRPTGAYISVEPIIAPFPLFGAPHV